MSTFAIGDIHGGLKSLVQCLKRSGFEKEKDTLITLGDIGDGWPETSECVDELLSIKNLITVVGNHDVWCRDWVIRGFVHPKWLGQGGQQTVDSYMETGKVMAKAHKEFWDNMDLYHIDDKNRLFVHAGYGSLGLKDTEKLNPKGLYWDRMFWDVALTGKHFNTMPHRLKEFETIFIGHTTCEMHAGGKPVKAANVWNLDTGGGFGGFLTIMNVDTEEYWQSDKVRDLYPYDKMRTKKKR